MNHSRLIRHTLSFLFAILLIAGVFLSATSYDPDPAAVPEEKIEEIFRLYDHEDAPGCALGIYRNGEMVYSRGFGIANLDYGIPITDTTTFYMASISKQVTAAAAGLLIIRGELKPDARVSNYLEDWPEWADEVRIHHLFNHTSGLPDLYDLMALGGISLSNVMELEDYYEIVKRGERLIFEPGSDESYTNSAYTVLALLIEEQSGDSFSAFVERELLQPLGMKNTHFHDDRSIIVRNRAISYAPAGNQFRRTYLGNFQGVGPGGLYSSLRDWNAWESFWSEHVTLEGENGMNQLEAEELRRMMTTPAVIGNEPINYGMGIQLEVEKGVEVHGHSGTFMGFKTDVRRYPENGLAFLTLCNRGDAEPRDLQRELANQFLEEEFEAYLIPYQGIYRNDELPVRYQLRVEGGDLHLDRRLSPNGVMQEGDKEDRWRAGSWRFDFQRGGSGEIIGFTLRTNRSRDIRFSRDHSYASDL